jgi:hypothetical protein
MSEALDDVSGMIEYSSQLAENSKPTISRSDPHMRSSGHDSDAKENDIS